MWIPPLVSPIVQHANVVLTVVVVHAAFARVVKRATLVSV